MAFFSEDLFTTLLCLERKRCERSGNPFGLGMLDICSLRDVGSFKNALCSQLRATDIPGWYHDPSVIGIIFTTLNGAPLPLVRTALGAKINTILQSILPPEDALKIPVVIRIFPEDIHEAFYPDLFASGRGAPFHAMKRAIDIAGSLTALTLLSPLFLAIGIMVKCSSPGPVFFRQKRLGLMAKEFEFLKFRTMTAGNDPSIHKEYVTKLIQGQLEQAPVYKIQNDPRITKVGRYLRRFSLDELPQFVNVLKGEMSLVGPRPPIPYEIEKYKSWHWRRILEVKPGITGMWQVYGRSRTTFDDMVRLDIRYITEQSPWLDFKIMLQTPRAVLSAAGAY